MGEYKYIYWNRKMWRNRRSFADHCSRTTLQNTCWMWLCYIYGVGTFVIFLLPQSKDEMMASLRCLYSMSRTKLQIRTYLCGTGTSTVCIELRASLQVLNYGVLSTKTHRYTHHWPPGFRLNK